MPVVQRGQSFQATVNNAKIEPKRWRRQFGSEIEAKAWEADSKLRLSRGELPDMGEGAQSVEYGPRTMRELADYMLKHHWSGTKSYKSTEINLNHMVELIGAETPLRKITFHTMNLCVAQLKEAGYPDDTINKKLSPARMCFKFASNSQRRWMDHVPDMPFYKPGEGRIRWFSDDEEAAMLKWCKERLHYLLWDYIVVSLDTGLRQGEVLNLKARNLYHEGRVTVWGQRTELDKGTKAANTRVVPLTPRAKEVLERLAIDNPGKLFPITKDQLLGMWNKMRDGLGFKDDPEFVAHVCRHTFCTRLVRAKVNLAVIQKLAGHERIETTLKYTKVDDDVLIEAIAELAARSEVVYTPSSSGASHLPHDTVVCHPTAGARSKADGTDPNLLKFQRKTA